MLSILSAISFDTTKIDENAITVFIIGFSVVFAALISIYLFFYFLPKVINFTPKDKKPDKKSIDKKVSPKENVKSEDSEVITAIAMALHLHFEDMHDEESMILTMDIKNRVNTQWGTKIANIN
jgi:Na+-transporting methylmalonyl-CoA/oxaloacetate decarboxylase gamma subunit